MESHGRGQSIDVCIFLMATPCPDRGSLLRDEVYARFLMPSVKTDKIRSTLIRSGLVESELPDTASARDVPKAFRRIAITSEIIAEAIAYAIAQSGEVDIELCRRRVWHHAGSRKQNDHFVDWTGLKQLLQRNG